MLYLELGIKMAWSVMGMMVENFRKALPLFRPIREIMISFCITGYLISKIPITGTASKGTVKLWTVENLSIVDFPNIRRPL